MHAPSPASSLLPMPVTDALNSERWRLSDPLSIAYVSNVHKVEFHMWMFASTTPVNAREYLFVGFGRGAGRQSVILALGTNNLEEALEMVGSEIKARMKLPVGGAFVEEARRRYPWIHFVSEYLSTALEREPPLEAPPLAPAARTVETMLQTVKEFGDLFEQTSARAIAHLSYPNTSSQTLKDVMGCCLEIGKLCRGREMEAVFWPSHLWTKAVAGAEIFTDANVPSLCIPDGPQLWYFEHPLPKDLDPTDPRYHWWAPGWQMSCMALLPARRNGTESCFSICILEKESAANLSVDDALPRVFLGSIGCAGYPCDLEHALVMAGLEFMQEVIPRTSVPYSRQVQRAAERRGEKLQPCSIMEVRRIERQASQSEDDANATHEGSRNYQFSFFQRRHRRKLKEPRKSDGVQVIRVAAGQKLKHLPLRPDAEQKVTKVSR